MDPLPRRLLSCPQSLLELVAGEGQGKEEELVSTQFQKFSALLSRGREQCDLSDRSAVNSDRVRPTEARLKHPFHGLGVPDTKERSHVPRNPGGWNLGGSPV